MGGVNNTYNPENGVFIDVGSANGYINIPNLAHVYISFGLFGIRMERQKELFNLYSGDTRIAKIQFYGSGAGIDLAGGGGVIGNVSLSNNQYYKILFEVALTGSKCNITLFVNGVKSIDKTYDCNETAITKVKVCNGDSSSDYGKISNIIIADVDCSDERIAICDLISNDGVNIDIGALTAKMAKYVDNAAITSLQTGASDIGVASSAISSIKETLNSTDIETKLINVQKGVIFENMAVNPLTGGNWTLSDLVSMKFKLTGVKV